MDKAVEKYQKRRESRIKERQARMDWEESDHPRDENGRFSSSGSSGGGKSGGALSPKKRKEAESLIKKIKSQKPKGGFTAAKLNDSLLDNIDKLSELKKGLSSAEQKEISDIMKKHGLL